MSRDRDRDKAVDRALASVAANVRRTRIQRGMTQAELGTLAGLEMRSIQHIESSGSSPTVATLVALAHALEVEPGVLLQPARFEPRSAGRPRKH